jgi:hypothetical protein
MTSRKRDQVVYERRRLGAFVALVAVLIVAGAVWYVIAPPKGADGYRERAAHTTEGIRSQVQSARIVVETFVDGELPNPATLVMLEEAERDTGAAASTFEGFEPPAGLEMQRSQFTRLAGRASDALADLRIAAQQEDWAALERLAQPLSALATRLQEFEEGVEP